MSTNKQYVSPKTEIALLNSYMYVMKFPSNSHGGPGSGEEAPIRHPLDVYM